LNPELSAEKVCTKCGVSKPRTLEHFYYQKSNRDHLQGPCKPCWIARAAAWRDQRYAEVAKREKPTTCDVCGRAGKIVFDHCHVTGAFRGWLCGHCNTALGQVFDQPDVLRALAAYLERS
jgi:hypothetical protein